MILSNFKIHHLGILVYDIEQAIDFYRSTCNYKELPRERLPHFNVEVAFLIPDLNDSSAPTAIELLQPIEQKGSIWTFLEKKGEGLHHICHEVADIAQEHARLTSAGLHFIDKEPRAGAHGSTVAFIHPKSCHGVLTELLQPANQGS
ncbi:methylmalonyl-CoA epimerase [bacterium]|nr:methylmalonyl-CoA epimerase [bacterium]